MLLVGLTGGIGSGKSTVARLLAARGAVILDADALARDALAKGTAGFDQVVALFGPEVVAPSGDLDRAAVASRVFADDRRRAELEAIVHPEVRRQIAERVAREATGDRVVVIDSPLLVETGAHQGLPLVVVVAASEPTRIARLVARGMDEGDARARLAAQIPDHERAAAADLLLDNEGSEPELEAQVDALWRDLASRAGRA
ncbi:MAG: dephospho-CoA kinase [Actinomycetota bacterium]